MKSDHLQWYRVFYETAKSGSLSKAAEELYITQPAVSYSIKQLEESLGSRLFFRIPKGVKLTPEGRTLYSYIEQAFHLVDSGERQLSMIQNLTVGEMTIGASDTLCKHYLLPCLEQFHKLYPDITIKVTNRTSLQAVDLLKQGKVDFAVIHLPLENTSQLSIQETVPLQDCLVVGEKYRELAVNGPIPLERLADYPLILLEEESNSRRYFDRFALSQGLSLSPEIELGSLELLVQFARIGLGVSYVVRNFIEAELQDGTLYEIPLTNPIPPRSIGIVHLNHVPLSPAAGEFITLLSSGSKVAET